MGWNPGYPGWNAIDYIEFIYIFYTILHTIQATPSYKTKLGGSFGHIATKLTRNGRHTERPRVPGPPLQPKLRATGPVTAVTATP
jgi:hypothetical protein